LEELEDLASARAIYKRATGLIY